MDARNPAARREIADLADLVGAVRLPGGAHQRAAGTERRHRPADPAPPRTRPRPRPDRLGAGPARPTLDGARGRRSTSTSPTTPSAVLGTLAAASGAYRADDLVVTPTGDTDRRASPPPWPASPPAPATAASPGRRDRRLTPASAASPGCQPSQHPDGYLQAHAPTARSPRSPTASPAVRGAPQPRPPSCAPCCACATPPSRCCRPRPSHTEDTARYRNDCAANSPARYDAYVRAYGPLNRFTLRRTGRTDPVTGEPVMARVAPPQGGFRDDPYAPLVYALEEFDPAGQRAAKAAIFTRRVVAPRTPRLGADTAADALAICLDTHGELRLDEIARLLGVHRGPGPRASSAPWSSTTPQPAGWSRPPSTCPATCATSSAPPSAPPTAIRGSRSTSPSSREVIPRRPEPRPRSTPGSARPGSTPPTSQQFLREILDDPGAAGRASRRPGLGASAATPAQRRWPPPPGAPNATPRRSSPRPAANSARSRSATPIRTPRRRPQRPQRRRDPGRPGEGRRAGRAVRRLGLGGPGPRRGPGRAPTTSGSTTSSCAATTTPSSPCPACRWRSGPAPHQLAAVAADDQRARRAARPRGRRRARPPR